MAVCASSFLEAVGPSHQDSTSQAAPPLSSSPWPPPSPGSSSPSFPVSAKGNLIPFDTAKPIADGRSVHLIAAAPFSTAGSDIARFIGPGMLSTCISATVSPPAEKHTRIDEVVRSLVEGCGLGSEGGRRQVGRVGSLVFPLHLYPSDTDEDGGERKGDSQAFLDALRQYLHERVHGAELNFKVLPIRDHTVSMAAEKELTLNRIPQAETGAGWVLVVKIAGALASMGYGIEDVKKVAQLVIQNVGTVSSSSSISASTGITVTKEMSTQDSIKEMLARLLHPTSSHLPGLVRLRVNSNEPVLLLNVSASISTSELRVLLTRTIVQLHDTYHIMPVRVYAGDYNIRDPDRDEDGREKKQFSISIVNVVNTEIGGPSMIQLLDEPCGAEGWRVGVTKEEWETCDGSTVALVELGVRNWEANTDSRDDIKSMRLASTRRDDGGFDSTERLEHEAEQGVPGTGAQQQQQMAGDEAGKCESETSAAENLEDSSEREIVDAREQYPEEATEQNALKFEEIDIGADQPQTVREPDENVLRSGSKEAMNKEAEQVEEDSKHTPPVGPGSVGPASSEEYEIVDRERTLIDMVFSHGER